MRRHRRWLGVTALLLVAAALMAWWPSRDVAQVAAPVVASAPDPAPADVHAAEATAPRSAGKIQTPRLEPLPPPNAPLAHVIPLLKGRADAGDRRAACRLALELLRCRYLDWAGSNEQTEKDEARAEAAGELATANHYAEERVWRIEREAECRNVPPDLRDRGAEYLAQAARAGDPHAMFHYAEGQHWPPDGIGIAAGPDFDAWRRDAPGMMHRALQAGNPRAAMMLTWAYSDDHGALSALIPDDPYQVYVHHLLVARLFGHREIPAMARDLNASEMARARRQAEDLHQRHFKGRRFPSETSWAYPPYVRGRDGLDGRFCEISE